MPSAAASREWWRPPVTAPVAPESGPAAPPESPTAFAGLLAFTVVLLLAPQSLVPALAPLRLALVAAGVASLALIAHRLAQGRPLTVRGPEITLAAILAAWALATAPLSLWPGGSIAFFADVYLKSLVIFWLIANVLGAPARLHRFAWALTLMAVPLGLTAVRHYLAGEIIAGAPARRIVGYAGPLTQNPNDLALTLNLLLPLGAVLFLARPRPAWRLVLLAGLVLDVIGVVLTFSRAGFLTLVVIAAALAWKLRWRAERWMVAAGLVLAVAALPFLPAAYVERLATITDTAADRTGSAQARWHDTGAALRYVARHPILGAGIGQDDLALNQERGARWTEIHNVYLQYAVELGLPGLVLFVLLLASALRTAGRAERRAAAAGMREVALLAVGVQVSLVAFAVAALFHPVGYHFYFYYLAGMAVALRGAAPPAPAPAAAPPRAGT